MKPQSIEVPVKLVLDPADRALMEGLASRTDVAPAFASARAELKAAVDFQPGEWLLHFNDAIGIFNKLEDRLVVGVSVTTVKTTTILEARGDGSITALGLRSALGDWPAGAYITHMEVGDSQRDGSWWSIRGQVTA